MNEDIGWGFVDTQSVVLLHRAACGLQEDSPVPPPRAGCVEGSVGSAITSSMYEAEDDEPDLLLATAYLLVYLAKNHCFTDGNKRAAWSAAVRALDMNSIRIVAEQADAAEMVEGVAKGALNVRDVLSWFTEPGRIVAAPEMS